jgi:hypothetical protein
MEASSRLKDLEVLRTAYDQGLFKMRLRAMLFSESKDDAA